MTSENIIEILRLASVIGVVSIGMTFVIIGGGIDLSVGAIVALSRSGRRRSRPRTWPRTCTGSSWCSMPWSSDRMRPDQRRVHRLRQDRAVHDDAGDVRRGPRLCRDDVRPADPDAEGRRVHRLLQQPDLSAYRCSSHLRADRGARLGPVQPHHVRTAHGRRRRQPGGGPARRHQRQPAHRPALRAASASCCGIAAAMLLGRDGRARPRTATSTSWTPSRPSSSAAPC